MSKAELTSKSSLIPWFCVGCWCYGNVENQSMLDFLINLITKVNLWNYNEVIRVVVIDQAILKVN